MSHVAPFSFLRTLRRCCADLRSCQWAEGCSLPIPPASLQNCLFLGVRQDSVWFEFAFSWRLSMFSVFSCIHWPSILFFCSDQLSCPFIDWAIWFFDQKGLSSLYILHGRPLSAVELAELRLSGGFPPLSAESPAVGSASCLLIVAVFPVLSESCSGSLCLCQWLQVFSLYFLMTVLVLSPFLGLHNLPPREESPFDQALTSHLGYFTFPTSVVIPGRPFGMCIFLFLLDYFLQINSQKSH